MLALLVISIAAFFTLFFAMLALLRRAATSARASNQAERRPANNQPERTPAPELYNDTPPTLRSKRPDFRFLVRDSRRPFPSGQTIAPARKPPARTTDGRTRSDWAHYNENMGDLNDPYQIPDQAPDSTARRA